MVAILILIVCIVNTVLLVRLNKCGRIVQVRQEYTYIPAPRKKVSRDWKKNNLSLEDREDEYE